MQSAHGSKTIAKVIRDLVALLLHRRVNEPSLFEQICHLLDPLPVLARNPSPRLHMKLDLLSLYPRGEIGRDTIEEQFSNSPMTQQESRSRLVPHTSVLAHVEINIEVHTLEWHVAFNELDAIVSHLLDEGLVVHDGTDSPNDFPFVRCVRDVADLDLHEVGDEREGKRKCGR